MEETLDTIDKLFETVLEKLQNHNEIFLIEDEEGFSYTTPEGEEAEPLDYQVYSSVDKYGHYNTYAIRELKDGQAYLIGVADTEGNKVESIGNFGIAELYDLARLCTNI